MARIEDLSDAQIILLAVELCCASQVEGLRTLIAQVPEIFGAELVLRILLTFLPASVEPSAYIPLLQSFTTGAIEVDLGKPVNTSSVDKLKSTDAEARVQKLGLTRLSSSSPSSQTLNDPVIAFLFQRANQIDLETRNLPTILQLVEPFIDTSSPLKEWVISILLPLVRSEYEYYVQAPLSIPLSVFNTLEPRAAVNALLQNSNKNGTETNISRDLRCLVGPWMYGDSQTKRRKLTHDGTRGEAKSSSVTWENGPESGWHEVNDWILTKSQEDFSLAATAFLEWDGPSDIDLGGYAENNLTSTESKVLRSTYVQTGISLLYSTEDSSQESLNASWRIFARSIYLNSLDSRIDIDASNTRPDIKTTFPRISALSRASLLHNALLHASNDLTRTSPESLTFLHGILASASILRFLGMALTCRKVVELCLFASEDVQKQEVHNLLQDVAKSNRHNWDWLEIREQIFWLQTWNIGEKVDQKHARAPFWRVDQIDLRMELLDALLTAAQYTLAVELFIKKPDPDSLTPEQVETVVERTILRNYDNASNGNRTRGGIKRASDMLKAFRPHISPTSPIHKIESLLAATHSLSFYQLTLQHGVPFQPVSIHVHPDPIALVGKVLEQDAKAYTKLDDLVSIGQNFVKAGLPIGDSQNNHDLPQDKAMLEAERRITYLSIEAALTSSDFDTAYSYILTRLTPRTNTFQNQTNLDSASSDNYSWRAAYLAGRHRPNLPSPGSLPLSGQITSLSKRMELLSLALTLTPTPDNLPEILGTWRRCDEELGSLKSAEAAEEAAWDARGDILTSVPGTFGVDGRDLDIEDTRRQQAARVGANRSRHYEDEAPMGLFDVARGAARAIGKSAFPLRAGLAVSQPQRSSQHARPPSPTFPQSPVGETGRSSLDFGASGDDGAAGGSQRLRKRDMVSNMVTQGVVSGLGWVLGAQPVDRSMSGGSSASHDHQGGQED